MNNRWKMNRIGFVNFWLYDEEDFEFEDGKLLLRGQNGSGKSITTQSFIPFVLDGDRTPSRLDPFGSSDRRMEYYFLGEEGRDEATGYLYLEFKKEESDEYRTIGIGQRAKRGKPMDFWGFLLFPAPAFPAAAACRKLPVFSPYMPAPFLQACIDCTLYTHSE